MREPQPVSRRTNMPYRSVRRSTIVTGIAVLICAVLAASLWYSWTNYFDAEYSFRMPIPFGWRANGYAVYYRAGDNCGHEVDLIPPVSEATYRESPPGDGGVEVIRLFIPLTCPGWETSYASLHSTVIGQRVTVGGTAAMLYDTSSNGLNTDRVAVAHFGGHEYDFGFHYEFTSKTPSDQAGAQLAKFMDVLRGFTYSGG